MTSEYIIHQNDVEEESNFDKEKLFNVKTTLHNDMKLRIIAEYHGMTRSDVINKFVDHGLKTAFARTAIEKTQEMLTAEHGTE